MSLAHIPTPGPATPDLTWHAKGPEFVDNRTALLDRGYAVTVPVRATGHQYGVRLEDLSGPESGADFTAPVFRALPGKEWVIISDPAELDILATDLRARFAWETAATRDFVAQHPGGW